MSHAITSSDSLFTVRKPAWHGLGVVLDRPPASIAQALEAAGLTWEVVQRPVETVDGSLIPELRAGDAVVIMSNGGFGGIHDKLLAALADGER